MKPLLLLGNFNCLKDVPNFNCIAKSYRKWQIWYNYIKFGEVDAEFGKLER